MRRFASRRALVGMATAVAGVAMLLFGPFGKNLPTNDCDVEELEVEGGTAMLLQVDDDDGRPMTVIWTEEEEEL